MSINTEYIWNWLGDRETFFCKEGGKKKDILDSGPEHMKKCCSILKFDDQDNKLYIKLNEYAKVYMHNPMGHLELGQDTDEIMIIHIDEDINVIEIEDTISELPTDINLRDLLI